MTQQPQNLISTTRFQLNYFDALSVPESGEIKNFRLFNQPKFIWPAFIKKIIPQRSEKSAESSLIFHVHKSFQDLPVTKWMLDETTYIDGTALIKNKTISEIRKSWNHFQQKNVAYKNTILILNSANLQKIMSETKSVFLINYLQLHSIDLATLIQDCLKYQCILVLNESQASGLPQLWTSAKNGIIQNFEKSFTYQLSLSELHDKSQSIQTNDIDWCFYEAKINELSRLYAKIKNQKEIKISYANMSRRS